MKINNTLIISLLFCFLQPVLSARTNSFGGLSNSYSNLPDSVFESQLLYNGRIWKNLFYMIREDQFLFSNQFLPGSVFIKGKSFNNIKLKYDIFKDEILIPYSPDGILQLTKELVDSFTIEFPTMIMRTPNKVSPSKKVIQATTLPPTVTGNISP